MRLLVGGLFYVFFVVTSALLFPGALLLWLVTRPFDRDGRALHLYIAAWAQLYMHFSPLWQLRVEGRERLPRRGAAVLVANHASFFDILALYALFRPFKWVAKKDLVKLPFIGWSILLNRHVTLERGDRESVARMMEQCERWLDRGMPVLLFPEGTRSPDGALLPFKDGAFRLAVKKGVPVIPIAIAGTNEILPKHASLVSPRGRCGVRVLAPVSPAECGGDVARLRERVRGDIVEERQRLVLALAEPRPRAARALSEAVRRGSRLL